MSAPVCTLSSPPVANCSSHYAVPSSSSSRPASVACSLSKSNSLAASVCLRAIPQLSMSVFPSLARSVAVKPVTRSHSTFSCSYSSPPSSLTSCSLASSFYCYADSVVLPSLSAVSCTTLPIGVSKTTSPSSVSLNKIHEGLNTKENFPSNGFAKIKKAPRDVFLNDCSNRFNSINPENRIEIVTLCSPPANCSQSSQLSTFKLPISR